MTLTDNKTHFFGGLVSLYHLLINADISDDRFRDVVVSVEGVFGFLGARGWGKPTKSG